MIINTEQRKAEQEALRRASLTQEQRDLEDRITILTKLEFLNRFTDTEVEGIYAAVKLSVPIEIWMDKFKLAEYINLDDKKTINGVNKLEANGLLAVGRAEEILK